MNDFDILEQIKKQIVSILPNSIVILFGSRARNDNTKESDFDLLIITDKLMAVSEKLNYRTKIRKLLLKLEVLSDILIESKSEIDTKQKLPGHIVRKALKEGMKL